MKIAIVVFATLAVVLALAYGDARPAARRMEDCHERAAACTTSECHHAASTCYLGSVGKDSAKYAAVHAMACRAHARANGDAKAAASCHWPDPRNLVNLDEVASRRLEAVAALSHTSCEVHEEDEEDRQRRDGNDIDDDEAYSWRDVAPDSPDNLHETQDGTYAGNVGSWFFRPDIYRWQVDASQDADYDANSPEGSGWVRPIPKVQGVIPFEIQGTDDTFCIVDFGDPSGTYGIAMTLHTSFNEDDARVHVYVVDYATGEWTLAGAWDGNIVGDYYDDDDDGQHYGTVYAPPGSFIRFQSYSDDDEDMYAYGTITLEGGDQNALADQGDVDCEYYRWDSDIQQSARVYCAPKSTNDGTWGCGTDEGERVKYRAIWRPAQGNGAPCDPADGMMVLEADCTVSFSSICADDCPEGQYPIPGGSCAPCAANEAECNEAGFDNFDGTCPVGSDRFASSCSGASCDNDGDCLPGEVCFGRDGNPRGLCVAAADSCPAQQVIPEVKTLTVDGQRVPVTTRPRGDDPPDFEFGQADYWIVPDAINKNLVVCDDGGDSGGI